MTKTEIDPKLFEKFTNSCVKLGIRLIESYMNEINKLDKEK